MDKIGTLIETALDLIREERRKAHTMGWIERLDMTGGALEEALEEWNKD